jgi:hypothetical protein
MAVVVWACALPAWGVEYRLQIVNLDDLMLSSYERGGDLSRLEDRLERGEFPPSAVIPGREVQLLDAPAYGGTRPARLSVLPTTRKQAWTTVIWEGHPDETFAFVVKTDTVAWQQVRRVGANPEGRMRRLSLGGPSWFGGRSCEVPGVSKAFLASAVDRGTFTRWLQRRTAALGGLSIVVGQGHHAFYNPDRVSIVVRAPATSHTFKVAIGWRDRDDRGSGPKEMLGL